MIKKLKCSSHRHTTKEHDDACPDCGGDHDESGVYTFTPGDKTRTPDEIQLRTLGLYGEVNEERASEIISGLIHFRDTAKRQQVISVDKDGEPTFGEFHEPIELILSTPGGSATDMMSIYDVMRQVQRTCEIHIFGVGRVMSAGVLLIAAGTKGHRRAGKHCRFMLHNHQSGFGGNLDDLSTMYDEVMRMQEAYIDELASLSKMSKKKLQMIMKTKTDFYFSAEEAQKFGIIDEVV